MRYSFIFFTSFALFLLAPRYVGAAPIFAIHTREKVVALTFDDGPNPQATPAIARILRQQHVPATFFEVGHSITRYPRLTKMLAEDGFELGDHSWDHPFHIALLPPPALAWEVEKTARLMEKITQQRPTLFRPPHGSWANNLVTRVHQEHFQTILWTVDSGDWATDDPARITSSVTDWVYPGAIIVMHDGIQDGNTAQRFQARLGLITALPKIITELRGQGYHFFTVSKLLRLGRPDNHPKRWIRPDMVAPTSPAKHVLDLISR